FSAVRVGDWKLIYFHVSGKLELYNLRTDLSETKDLAGAQPKKLRELTTTLTKFLQDTDAQMPTDRRTGKPVPLPEATVN
ncbi:unnamed protein product, partial [marine sediment metagenome]